MPFFSRSPKSPEGDKKKSRRRSLGGLFSSSPSSSSSSSIPPQPVDNDSGDGDGDCESWSGEGKAQSLAAASAASPVSPVSDDDNDDDGDDDGCFDDVPSDSGVFGFSALDIEHQDLALKTLRPSVLLIVNVASKWGLTAQNYTELQQLHERHAARGLAIIGFPCNQFGLQEPWKNERISAFTSSKFGVTFQLMDKINVNGRRAHPLFKHLKKALPGGLLGLIKWNFTKFLCSRDGTPLARFSPAQSPLSFEADIIRALDDAEAKESAPSPTPPPSNAWKETIHLTRALSTEHESSPCHVADLADRNTLARIRAAEDDPAAKIAGSTVQRAVAGALSLLSISRVTEV